MPIFWNLVDSLSLSEPSCQLPAFSPTAREQAARERNSEDCLTGAV